MQAEMKDQKQSRARGRVPALPKISDGAYLWRAFADLGMAEGTGFGIAPVRWAEVMAFVEMSDGMLTAWDGQVLRRMSSAYCAGRELGKDPFAYPPWDGT